MNLTTYHPLAGQAVTLYQAGLGLRTIAARLRQPKTSVRRWLIEAGVYGGLGMAHARKMIQNNLEKAQKKMLKIPGQGIPSNGGMEPRFHECGS